MTELERFIAWCEMKEIFPATYRADGKRIDYASWSSTVENWRTEERSREDEAFT